MEINPNLHRIPGVTASVYLVIDPDGLTLIDTGLPRSSSKILEYLASLGHSAEDLQRILITHADSDHVGGLAGLQEASPARTFAHPLEARAIQAGEFSRPLKLSGLKKWLFDISRRFFKATPARVDETLEGNHSLPVLGGLGVIETPGHTHGHLSFYAPTHQVLFCGDSLRCPGGEIKISQGANTWDESRAKGSARLQAELGAQIVCPGHGEIVRDAEAKFQALLATLLMPPHDKADFDLLFSLRS